jgi:mono/diheme cytochrome c family protein
MHGRFTAAAWVVVAAVAAWFLGMATAQEPARTVWDGVYSAAQAELGMHRYTGPCGSCHGRALEGAHIYGSRTRTAPPLRGEVFLSHWTGNSVGALFNEISTYMPLDHPGSLSDEANASIVAFLMRENGFPPGSHDLPADVAIMKTIQIVSQKK